MNDTTRIDNPMKVIAVIFVAAAVAAMAITGAVVKSVREQHRTDVARACIEAGGKYHETIFTRRPKCKGVDSAKQ